MRRPLDFSIRSTSSCTSARLRIRFVSSCRPLRAMNTRLGSLIQISSTSGSSRKCCSGPKPETRATSSPTTPTGSGTGATTPVRLRSSWARTISSARRRTRALSSWGSTRSRRTTARSSWSRSPTRSTGVPRHPQTWLLTLRSGSGKPAISSLWTTTTTPNPEGHSRPSGPKPGSRRVNRCRAPRPARGHSGRRPHPQPSPPPPDHQPERRLLQHLGQGGHRLGGDPARGPGHRDR